MGAAIRLREDFDAVMRRSLAKCSRDGAQSRRLLALAAIYDGQGCGAPCRGAHRAHVPGAKTLDSILTAVEALLYRLYVLPGEVKAVQASTPKRPPP